jgi:hypothetical protein
MGSSIVCERVTTSKPANAISSWQDGDSIFYLREKIEGDLSMSECDSKTGLIHAKGTSSAVWTIGTNAFCKVKAWCTGMELESDTIQFVKWKVPCTPLPKVIHSWVDEEWNRSFLIMKRVVGQTLRDAWPQLPSPQRMYIANGIAKHCAKLAAITSLTFESATGCGVLEPFLMAPAEPSHPSWKPRLLGPLPLAKFATYISNWSNTSYVDIGFSFHFYHADLGPDNIIVSKDGSIEAILNWESAGFYPRFWIASKLVVSQGFNLNPTEETKKGAWRELLGSMLKKQGYEPIAV